MTDITPILSGIITIIAAVISAFLIPWIKEKLGTEKFNNIYRIVEIAVAAAEQIYDESGMGEVKKQYVKDYLQSIGVKYDEDTIENMIESAVNNLTAKAKADDGT